MCTEIKHLRYAVCAMIGDESGAFAIVPLHVWLEVTLLKVVPRTVAKLPGRTWLWKNLNNLVSWPFCSDRSPWPKRTKRLLLKMQTLRTCVPRLQQRDQESLNSV